RDLGVSSGEGRAGPWRHDVLIGSGVLANGGELIKKRLRASRCTIISDAAVAPLFADRISKILTSTGFQPTLITIPSGEKSKTLEQAGAICDQMIAAGLDRQSFVVGLGGGGIGDVSGFVDGVSSLGVREDNIAQVVTPGV